MQLVALYSYAYKKKIVKNTILKFADQVETLLHNNIIHYT